ncbi:FMN-binding protein [Novipirellula artificiosorum]|uniref:Uncharacterized protein n=1 Tax=Novipirellula artificiosorum TaxID=2528016 RepID=A0A5C6DE93_9BACT|nr:FMN-binding protein [Novipirellula artificiosorum]TWU34978.1 hypothetical protein Poly41_41220 [Novipirellula artificiosorum]
MVEIARHRALALLTECTGDDIWSVEHCRAHRVPEQWIDELADNFESGFRADSHTIYFKDKVTNQFRGVRDIDLAVRIAESLGLQVDRVTAATFSRRGMVAAIKQAIMDGD